MRIAVIAFVFDYVPVRRYRKVKIRRYARDRVAGFVYIGTPKVPPEERPRPDLDKIVTLWTQGAQINRGDAYDGERG